VRETLSLTLSKSVLLQILLTAAILVCGPQASAQSTPQPDTSAAPPDEVDAPANTDSLLIEVRRYHRLISNLRDSLAQVERERGRGDRLGEEALDEAMEEFSGVISNLSRELSELDLDIDDQTISLRDRDGGGIEINIPEDLGEQISKGISSITQVILNDLPDTLSWSRGDEDWQQLLRVKSPSQPRRVIGGDAIKIWNDIEVNEDEEIHGDVVTVFGDALISGKVDGSVIVVLGDLELSETAEVTGEIVTVLGQLDRDEDAIVRGSEFVLDPYLTREFGGLRELFAGGWLAFLAKQVIFLMVAFLVLILLAVFPSERLVKVEESLVQNPVTCLAYGVLVALLGHIGLTLLFGVLILTVIGIPLALLLLLGVIFFGLLAVATVALQVGRWVCRVLNLQWTQNWLVALLGLLLLHSLTFIGALIGFWHLMTPLALVFGILGLGAKVLVYCIGIGALILSRLGTRSTEVPVSTVPQV